MKAIKNTFILTLVCLLVLDAETFAQQQPNRSGNQALIDRSTEDQLAAAQRALDARDYAAALRIYRPLADRGVPAAQGGIALLFSNGWGVEKNDIEALRWNRLAAEQGYAPAQANLAYAYGIGSGTAQDEATAVQWFRRAADQGNRMAQSFLGFHYEHGRGIRQDFREAFNWYSRAADQGHPLAQRALGWMYIDARGMPRNEDLGISWIRRSADQGLALAQVDLGLAHYEGRIVRQDYTVAALWFRRASEQGDAGGRLHLGVAYAEGNGVPKDEQEATRLFRLASDQGNALAQYNLAYMFETGRGVSQNLREAERYYAAALSGGSQNAAQDLHRVRQMLTQLANTPPPLAPGQLPPAGASRPTGPAGVIAGWDDGASDILLERIVPTMAGNLFAAFGVRNLTVGAWWFFGYIGELPILLRDLQAGHSLEDILSMGEEQWDQDGCGYTQTVVLQDSRIPRRINGTVIDGEKAGFSIRVRFRMAPQDVENIRINPFSLNILMNPQQIQLPLMLAATGGNQIISVERSTGVLRNRQIVFGAYGEREFIPVIIAAPGVSQAEMGRTLMALRTACGG